MQIEVISIGGDFDKIIQDAIEDLNLVQKEFIFQLPPQTQRSALRAFLRDPYTKTEAFEKLSEYRQIRNNSVNVLGFIDRRLEGDTLPAGPRHDNLFAAHRAERGVAVATLHDCRRFVADTKIFCRYYMARYALSFVDPAVKTHQREEDPNCYFHRKLYKPDIVLSMKSGRICNICRRQLKLSSEQWIAFDKLADIVRGAAPYALVMKGGGPKGLAFAGAMKELENHFSFDTFAGTSAGAIAASLFAAGYRAVEVETALRAKNLLEFLDARQLLWPFNLILHGGIAPGENFRLWLKDLIAVKIKRQGDVQMRHLMEFGAGRAIIYASRYAGGTVVFDSSGERAETPVDAAARCSMSLPIIFFPEKIDGYRTYDGGLLNNFPVARFIVDNPNQRFIGLYLAAARPRKRNRLLPLELIDVLLNGDELQIVDRHLKNIVIIDPSPVSTYDFNLNDTAKNFLIESGRLAALNFLLERKIDKERCAKEIPIVDQNVRTLREKLVAARCATGKALALHLSISIIATCVIWIIFGQLAGVSCLGILLLGIVLKFCNCFLWLLP